MNILSKLQQLTSRGAASWKPVLMAAFLSFGMVIPSSAECVHDFARGLRNPQISADVAAPALPLAAAHDSAEIAAGGIVGLWNVTFISGGQTVDVAFDVWHSDGTEILNDYTNPIEGNVCLGVWKQTGPRTFKLKHPSWSFDTDGNFLGTVIIRETVTLSPDGNEYKGQYTYDIFDTSGAFVAEYTGSIAATRIRVD